MRKISYDPLLKKLIDAKLSKTELAQKVSFSRTTLAKIGKNEPVSIDALLRICDELKTSPKPGLEYKILVWLGERPGWRSYGKEAV